MQRLQAVDQAPLVASHLDQARWCLRELLSLRELMTREASKAAITRSRIPVDLALQGGGSHGAFTWGVLDRLLEEPWLEIDAISGTSAGAMNAAVLIDGWAEGGRAGAR